MATVRDQIEHFEHNFKNEEKPWKTYSKSRSWLKKQMNRFMRRKNKEIQDDDIGYKTNKKPVKGWEY